MTPPHTAHIVGFALALVAGLAAVGAAAALRPGGESGAAPARQETFAISGRVVRPLRPGGSGALNLRLTNGHRYSLRITRLFVSLRVDAAHVAAGCDRSANFAMLRLRRDQYPIRLQPRRTRSLRRLGVQPLPHVFMRMLATNQDACKNARIALRFAGRAHRWYPDVPR